MNIEKIIKSNLNTIRALQDENVRLYEQLRKAGVMQDGGTIEAVAERLAQEHGYTLAQLVERNNHAAITSVRHTVMYALYSKYGYRQMAIARLMKRERSLVANAIAKMRMQASGYKPELLRPNRH